MRSLTPTEAHEAVLRQLEARNRQLRYAIRGALAAIDAEAPTATVRAALNDVPPPCPPLAVNVAAAFCTHSLSGPGDAHVGACGDCLARATYAITDLPANESLDTVGNSAEREVA